MADKAMHIIWISQEDIEASIPGSLDQNPIANALRKNQWIRDIEVGQKIRFHSSYLNPGYKEIICDEFIEDYLRHSLKNDLIGTASLTFTNDFGCVWIKEYETKFQSLVLQFPITKEITEKADTSETSCPLALSVNNNLHCHSAHFDGMCFEFYHDGDHIFQETSRSVENYIAQHDGTGPSQIGMLYIFPNGRNQFIEMTPEKLDLETKMLQIREIKGAN